MRQLKTNRLILEPHRQGNEIEYTIKIGGVEVGDCCISELTPIQIQMGVAGILETSSIGTWISYDVKERYRGLGIIPEALEAIMREVTTEISTIVMEDWNQSSIRVAEKLGFTRIKQVSKYLLYQLKA